MLKKIENIFKIYYNIDLIILKNNIFGWNIDWPSN